MRTLALLSCLALLVSSNQLTANLQAQRKEGRGKGRENRDIQHRAKEIRETILGWGQSIIDEEGDLGQAVEDLVNANDSVLDGHLVLEEFIQIPEFEINAENDMASAAKVFHCIDEDDNGELTSTEL